MVSPRFKLGTATLEGTCSIRLSYETKNNTCRPVKDQSKTGIKKRSLVLQRRLTSLGITNSSLDLYKFLPNVLQ